MAKVEIYTTFYCGYCQRAKALLAEKNVSYHEISVDTNPELRREMEQRSKGHTVPQIFINDQSIGGCDELYQLEARGELNQLLDLD